MLDTGTDAELVRAAQTGDPASLGRLLERHAAPLRALAVSMLGPGPAAEDAVHDTFVTALCKIHTVREPAAAGGWLRQVLRNTCLMQHRRYRAEVLLDDSRPAAAAVAPSVEEELDRLLLRDWVWRAIEALSEPLRLVTILRYFSSFRTYQQIATVCGVPVGTVRSRLNEARRRLADQLLSEAAELDTDERRRCDERVATLRGAVDDLNQRHDPRAFTEPCAEDLVLAAGGEVATGLPALVAGLESDFAAGVKLHLVNVVASREITVAEGRFENPVADPTHCPPVAIQVHFHPAGRTRRLAMHYADGEPAA